MSPKTKPVASAVKPENTVPPPKNNNWIWTLLIFLGLTLSVSTTIFILRQQTKPQLVQTTTAVATPTYGPSPTTASTPTPAYLPPGKQTYNISQSKDMKGPTVTQLILDPLAAKKGDRQTIEVLINSLSQVSSVSISYFSDFQKRTFNLQPVGDTKLAKTIWKTSWKLDDSVWYRYVLVINATNADGQAQVIVAPRTSRPISNAELK